MRSLGKEESTRTVMAGLWEVIDGKACSVPCTVIGAATSSLRRRRVDKQRLTQAGRAMKELGVQMIPAYSPQARGRSERSFGTWQGRLPQELRLAGITDLEGANRFLRERYVAEFNTKFSVPATEAGIAFRRCCRNDLKWIFTIQTERIVAKDSTVAIGDRSWQIGKSRFPEYAGCTVTIHEHLDGTVSIRFGPHTVGRFDRDGRPVQDGGSRRLKRNRTDHVLIKPDILTCYRHTKGALC
jgi:hypothetical protein